MEVNHHEVIELTKNSFNEFYEEWESKGVAGSATLQKMTNLLSGHDEKKKVAYVCILELMEGEENGILYKMLKQHVENLY